MGHWFFDKEGKLAAIILCDQMSRNIYRGMAGAFSFDHISQRLSKHIVAKIDMFDQYALFEKLFIIMPLMNSETEEDCQLCADVLSQMIDQLKADKMNEKLDEAVDEAAEAARKKSKDNLINVVELNRKWCYEHLEILRNFGRYPHRNKVLGRDNTEEEDLYLRDAASFGQN